MKKRPKMILAAAGVLASAAFYVLSGERVTPEDSAAKGTPETEILLQEAETLSEGEAEQIRTIVCEAFSEAVKSEISRTVREVLASEVEEMAENGRLQEGLERCAEKEAGLININTAGKEELKSLSGIGDVKADSILRFREEKGQFSSVEELLLVDGISPALLEKIRPYIIV